MRKPRAKRAPRGPRVRRRHRAHPRIGIWSAQCRACKAKFRVVYGPKPKTCISCKSPKLDIKKGRMNKEERMERDMRFMNAATRLVSALLDAFGIHLPPPPSRPPTMDRYEAALFLAVHSGCIPKDYILDSPEACERAYKLAARKLHPDAGGSHELFVKLQEAKAALDTVKGSV